METSEQVKVVWDDSWRQVDIESCRNFQNTFRTLDCILGVMGRYWRF